MQQDEHCLQLQHCTLVHYIYIEIVRVDTDETLAGCRSGRFVCTRNDLFDRATVIFQSIFVVLKQISNIDTRST